jgi:glycosyltransferase involved in cell wall biosynthesis
MRVGIYCHYGRSEATQAALQAARVAAEQGHDVTVLPREKNSFSNQQWDKHLVRGKSSPWEWLRSGLDYVVCDGLASPEFLANARKNNVKTYLICLWDELDESHLRRLADYDRVVFPSRKALSLVKERTELTNLSHVLWDAGMPVTRNPYELDPARVGVVWPLEGSQPQRQEPKFLPVIENLMSRCPNAFVTVVYGQLPAAGQKDLKRLVQVAEGRLEVMRDLPQDRQQYLYGRHDLTVWPSLVESAGLTGLASLFMGTPVVAFDHPVVGDVVKDGVNGVLVPCELDYNALGIPFVQPDYKLFARTLVELVKDPPRLTKLRHGASVGLAARRDRFSTFWSHLFEQ